MEQDAALCDVDKRVELRAFCAKPEMLDGMGVGRELAGAMLFAKTEKFSLAVVK